ncbi:YbhB and YbcL [Halomonas citrativorans]|uniref:YbhB and YbcL n=1 Tax=Halomonas citrativorans TaxID=2742612 RepID=A0A1R4I5X1_9GAMM|nr:YbhB/YbcL family Raf kinase inhibitor-like protein [Halomonas citrativorans]SJN15014.1 YbhB and YbcL [Halomonas citrativorans]
MAFALSSMEVTSTAFEQHQAIPARYTGEGDDISPPLEWHNVPEGTKGFAVICHDPDAPLVKDGRYGFVHWTLYNLPSDIGGLDENTQMGTCGNNDFDKQGYGGPMPPEGHGKHLYYFLVLALDQSMDLPQGLSVAALFEKVEPHVLGIDRLVGTYQRG